MTIRATFCAFLLIGGCAPGQTLSPVEQKAAIRAVREYALSYTKRLPNYTCTQTTRQTLTRPPGRLLRASVIEEQLSFVDSQEIRRITRVDGRPVSGPVSQQEAAAQPPQMSWGEFGNLLDVIFEPGTGADLRWDRVATLNRRRVDVIAFHVPQPKGYVLTESKRTIQVPFEGFVYADAQTHTVVRIQMKCAMIPDNSEYQAVDLTLDYKPARVAGQEFILPSRYQLNFRTDQLTAANEAEYTAYRRFSADATIQFEGDNQ
jgi:hypothetical protein